MDNPTAEAKRVLLKVKPAQITEIHTTVEACDYFAVVRTLDPEIAVIELIATVDTFEQTVSLAKMFEELLGAKILSSSKL